MTVRLEGSLTPFTCRHPNLVLERRAARHRRRQEDSDRKQVRLGGEAGREHRAWASAGGRVGHSVP